MRPESEDDAEDESRDGYYSIQVALRTSVIQGEESDSFVDTFKGPVTFLRMCGADVQAGHFRAYRVRLADAQERGISSFDVFDMHSQELSDYYPHLFGKDEEFSRNVPGREDIFTTDVLILDLIEILPEHRGRGLGLAVAHRLIQLLGPGCAIVACKPFPLQFSATHLPDTAFRNDMKYESMGAKLATAQRKLRAYWGRLGFKRVGRSEVYCFNLSMSQPELNDLVDEAKLCELSEEVLGRAYRDDALED